FDSKDLCRASLELKVQSKLECARCVAASIRINCPEGGVSLKRIRLAEARMIEEVEHLLTHVQFHAFPGHKRFVDIHIHVVDTVDAKAGKVARSIARILVAWVAKAARVEEISRWRS